MTPENIFVNKLLFSLNISDFSLSLRKTARPTIILKNLTPIFPATLEVENLRKLETIVTYKALPSLSQENRKTIPSALLDTSTT